MGFTIKIPAEAGIFIEDDQYSKHYFTVGKTSRITASNSFFVNGFDK